MKKKLYSVAVSVGIALLMLAFSADTLHGQATIVSDALDNSSTHFTVTNASGYYTGDSPSGFVPASSPYAISGYGLVRLGDDFGTIATLISAADINTYGFENIELILRLAAFGNQAGRGLDGTDVVTVAISTNGGSNYTTYLTVNGNDNAAWAYSATGVASAVFGTPATFAPAAGGLRTTDGYSTLRITSLPATTTLRVRITLSAETGTPGSEFWVIDDFKVTGDYLSPITTGTISGSPFCVTASAGAAVSVPFTSSGTFVDNTFTAQLSDPAGSFASPTAIGTLVSDESSGTISATIPAGTATGTGYRIRVQSSSPEVSGPDNGTDLVINLASNSIAPEGVQNINAGINGTALTVSEQSVPVSRTWYYGTAPGGPYGTSTGVTNATYTPGFASQGTYYVVCISEFACASVTSNEVQVNVSPTVTTGTVTGSPFCVTASTGSSVTVPFTSAGTFTSNTYTAQLSDAAGSFASPANIGTLTSDANSGSISATIPAGTATGTGYRVRVSSSSPALEGADNGADLTINYAANNIAPGAVMNITAGTDGSLLTVTEQSAASSRGWYYSTVSGGPYPTNTGVTTATYTPNFATQGTYYVVCISEFACASVTSNEVQVNVVATVTTGTVTGSPFCITATEGVSVTVPFTSAGTFDPLNTYTAELSDASGSFASPAVIGSLNGSGNSGDITASIPANTPSGTGYRIRVVSSNPALTGSESTLLSVVNGVSDVSSPLATPGFESAELSWTNPASCFQEIMIVAREGIAAAGEPTGNGSAYTADPAFGSGTEFYGGYVLYKGVTSPQTVTNLANGITYYFTFFTRNGTNWSAGAEIYATPASYPGGARWAVASGDWALPATWSDMPGGPGGASVPASDGNVYITADYNIYNVPSITLNSLNISGNARLSGSAPNTITITSNLEVAAGRTLTLGGESGYARMNILLSATATGTINGTVSWSDGSATVYSFTNNGSLTMGPAGVIRRFTGADDRTAFVLNAGATLTIGSSNGIVMGSGVYSGNIQTYTRTFDAGANYVFNGIGAQSTGDAMPVTTTGTITVAAGAVLAPNYGTGTTINNNNLITINGALTIPESYTLESTGSGVIVINSDAVNSGSLFIDGTVNATGKVTYNRSMPADLLYHYIASPVSPTVAATGTFYPWDEPSDSWGATTTALSSGSGYAIRGGADLSFTGSLVTSNIVVEASSPYSDLLTGGETEYERAFVAGRDPDNGGTYGGGGWNLLGNPYASAMLVSAFIDENFSETPADNQFDPNYVALYLYNGSSYQYVTKDETGWGTDWPDGTYLNTTHIQAGQGFFVLAMNDDAEFTFTHAMQEHSTAAILLKSAKAKDRWPGLQLKVNTGEKESSTTVVFGDGMSTGLDPMYDIGLMSSGSEVEIYTALVEDNGVNFGRQALPENGAVKNVVPVGINLPKGGSVTFTADVEPFRNYKFWLEDRVTGIFTDLRTKGYSVTLPAKTLGTGRFFIHTTAGRSLRPRETSENLNDIRIWTTHDNRLIIQGTVSGGASCVIYDIHGQKVSETILAGDNYNSISLPSLKNGVYLVRVTDGAKQVTQRVVLL